MSSFHMFKFFGQISACICLHLSKWGLYISRDMFAFFFIHLMFWYFLSQISSFHIKDFIIFWLLLPQQLYTKYIESLEVTKGKLFIFLSLYYGQFVLVFSLDILKLILNLVARPFEHQLSWKSVYEVFFY